MNFLIIYEVVCPVDEETDSERCKVMSLEEDMVAFTLAISFLYSFSCLFSLKML